MKKELCFTSKHERGFTLLEILMALLLIAILAAVGISAFVNYTKDTKNAATKSNLQIVRNGIATQFANLTLHCNDLSSTWPALATLGANDITQPNANGGTTGSCLLTDVGNVNDRQFVAGVTLPVNPWGLGVTTQAGGAGNAVYDCTAGAIGTGANTLAAGVWTATVGGPLAACLPSAGKDCSTTGAAAAYTGVSVAGAAGAATNDGWCYDPTSGRFWANSANNGGIAGATENFF